MEVRTSSTDAAAGVAAANHGIDLIRQTLADRGACNLVVATGASQLNMINALVEAPDIDWTNVTAFHLDEYIGLPMTHPASFRRYLWQRFVRRLPLPLRHFYYLDGESDPQATCAQVGGALRNHPIDVAFIGIGENGHLAFNDPPADFETKEPYLVVELDEACRRQQVGEGWFESLEQVPTHAISMSVQQILSARHLVCTVPDRRKARAVRDALEGLVTPTVPASILQEHQNVMAFLDTESASLLTRAGA